MGRWEQALFPFFLTKAICLKQRPGLFRTAFRQVSLGTERLMFLVLVFLRCDYVIKGIISQITEW